MKVIANHRFEDYKEKTVREPGDEFVISQERFDEIEAKLPGFITEVIEKETPEKGSPKPSTKKAVK